MIRCTACGRPVTRSTLHEYQDEHMGIPIVLYDAAIEERCEHCNCSSIEIPDLKGLIAAIAVCRVMVDQKLRGKDLRFLRTALGMTARSFAELVGVSGETISRWENDKEPITPSTEKLIRLTAGALLEDQAPAVTFDQKKIAEMKIKGVAPMDGYPPLGFNRVAFKAQRDKKSEPHWENHRLAA